MRIVGNINQRKSQFYFQQYREKYLGYSQDQKYEAKNEDNIDHDDTHSISTRLRNNRHRRHRIKSSPKSAYIHKTEPLFQQRLSGGYDGML